MSQSIVAAVALVDDLHRPTRVLAARRSTPAALAGGWEFPGGKVEPGERPERAAAREAWEELGVRIRLGSRVGPDWPLDPPWSLRLWWAVALPGQPHPRALEDHDDLRWLGVDDLGSVPWLPHDRPIVEHLVALLHGPGPGETPPG